MNEEQRIEKIIRDLVSKEFPRYKALIQWFYPYDDTDEVQKPKDPIKEWGGSLNVSVIDSFFGRSGTGLTFDFLCRLSDALQTKLIDVAYEPEQYYSPETGGDPSEFYLRIMWKGLDNGTI